MSSPFLIFFFTFLILWISARFGAHFRLKRNPMEEGEREDYNVIVAGALTLLGLISGFTFSMASSHYDLRKNYEKEEASAIGTEYLRVQLLPQADAGKLQQLLRSYLERRIAFYHGGSSGLLQQVDSETTRLQSELWDAVRAAAQNVPTSLGALCVSGMNDVLNTHGYTQAAWWNRIPIAAWSLMLAIAILCDFLIGYTSHRADGRNFRYFLLPLIGAITFLLIADIDSPLGGVIRVHPQNLESLAQTLSRP